MNLIKSIFFAALLSALFSLNALAQATGSIAGQVVDAFGAIIVGATVTAVDANGKEKTATTNKNGEYSITGLQAGTYILRVAAPNFALFENADVQVTAGKKSEIDVSMTVQAVAENVEVGSPNEVSTDPNNNQSATVLKDKDLDALPDDPDELEAALQALAGPAAGPNGGQIYIDGMTGGRMPPKEAIREIRINQNPFSAEFDRVGFGRIEILTKPGFDKLRGSMNFNFNDESLNSRNPFALNRASTQMRNYGGFISGPIQAKKSSFFVDVNRSENDSNNVISAIILDPSLNVVSYNKDITVPNRRFSISPRIDFTLNDKNTVQTRYSFTRSTSDFQGIGGFSLESRGTSSSSTQHSFNITESMIVNPKTVNETRFQFEWNKRESIGDNSIPTINVANAFTGGGSQIGDNFTTSRRWELQNYTTTSFGKAGEHAVKFGIRVRGINITDQSESNYGGTFTFSGFVNDNGTPTDTTDDFFVSSIEQFRQKVLGNPDPRYNPNQFTITTGNPLAGVTQVDYGPFITDDWRIRPDFTLSLGLRYENQTNIKDNFNFAPRLGFAWAPGTGGPKPPKTVFRGGFGVFFDRFSESSTLRARRNDGISQLQYVVTTNQNNILGQAVFTNVGVTNTPTPAQLAAFVPLASTPYRIAGDLQSPYSLQTALSIERQLPKRTVLSATFTMAKSLHLLRQRNVNAPICPSLDVCPTVMTAAQIQARRPDPTQGNIYQVESSGYSISKLFTVGLRSNLNPRITLNGGYTLSYADGDTDSLNSPRITVNAVGFPAYSYDLSNEFAPSAFNARHSVFVFGSISLPWRIRMNPMVVASSGRRFNITSGFDTNHDSLFFDRPSFAELHDACVRLNLNESYCDISGIGDPNAIIPRNYGVGPGSFNVNLNLSKTFGFGGSRNAGGAGAQGNQGGDNRANRGGGGGGRGGAGGGGGGARGPVFVGGGPGGGGGGGGFFGGGETPKRFNLTFGMNIQNLFNTVNLSSPVGALTSPSFGRSRSTGGSFGFFGGGGGGAANRRIDLSVRFNW
jgi:hypothetical protein